MGAGWQAQIVAKGLQADIARKDDGRIFRRLKGLADLHQIAESLLVGRRIERPGGPFVFIDPQQFDRDVAPVRAHPDVPCHPPEIHRNGSLGAGRLLFQLEIIRIGENQGNIPVPVIIAGIRAHEVAVEARIIDNTYVIPVNPSKRLDNLVGRRKHATVILQSDLDRRIMVAGEVGHLLHGRNDTLPGDLLPAFPADVGGWRACENTDDRGTHFMGDLDPELDPFDIRRPSGGVGIGEIILDAGAADGDVFLFA